jgi:K+-transporting ATPase ATPase C chain
MKTLMQSLRMIFLMTLVTGVLYPLLILGLARAWFPDQASGSLIIFKGSILGSKLLAQKCDRADLFWPRPSATDYQTIPSGASDLGPTSSTLATAVKARRSLYGQNAPSDLLTTSASGLDPDISVEAAMAQIPRIALARKIDEEQLRSLIEKHAQSKQWGLFGEPRVNVLSLNVDLLALKNPTP